MLDQPGSAAGALKAMAAGPAQGQRRVAAPVEKEQRLLPGLKGRGELGDERRREETPALGPLAAHVHQPYRGKLGRSMAARQDDALVTAARDVDQGFERRRRR